MTGSGPGEKLKLKQMTESTRHSLKTMHAKAVTKLSY